MKILFAADKFEDEPRDDVSPYPGGAELTDSALIEACPFTLQKKKFIDLKESDLETAEVVVIGNSKTASKHQLNTIISKKKYILFEHDMRICRYDGDWSRAKKEPVHYFLGRCICPHFNLRPLYKNAQGVIFLTHLQYNTYKSNPFFTGRKERILGSSAFSKQFIHRVEKTRRNKVERDGCAVLFSPHRCKGFHESLEYCRSRGVEPVQIKGIAPEEVLDLFEKVSEFVYLSRGIEWAGRMPVEARFLGCKVVINDNVGVGGEAWWEWDDERAFEFLKKTPERFWKLVEELVDEDPD